MATKERLEEIRKMIKEHEEKTQGERLLEPYEMFGIECGEGWDPLYRPIMDWIDKYNDEHPGDVITITQIKEKFGRLEFYVDKRVEELSDMIRDASAESLRVCETCGTRKNVGITVGGWYRTICLDCLQKMLNNANYYKNEDLWRKNDDGKVYKVTYNSIEEYGRK